MIPKSAIKKAVSGGWNSSYLPNDEEYWTREHFCVVALDLSFWQALFPWTGFDGHYIKCALYEKQDEDCNCSKKEEWKEKAHHFYDLILTGGNTEKFWQELLN